MVNILYPKLYKHSHDVNNHHEETIELTWRHLMSYDNLHLNILEIVQMSLSTLE